MSAATFNDMTAAVRSGWIGVDLDGTLAKYDTWVGPGHIGEPVPLMVSRVKQWLAQGQEVRIMTARCWPIPMIGVDEDIAELMTGRHNRLLESLESIATIRAWCREHLGQVLAVTCQKDFSMIELYDDRCRQVRANTGELVG